MYHVTLKCCTKWMLAVLFVFIVWTAFSSGTSSLESNNDFKYTCNMTKEYLNDLEKLIQKVHTILNKHNVVNFLCYGTLWGQIRIGDILPWSQKAELCVLNAQVDAVDIGHLYSSFHSQMLRLRYFSGDGVYRVEDTHRPYPFVEIFVFDRDEQQQVYKRVGWKRRLLPPHCDWTPSLDCFPLHLLQLPLPPRKLGRFMYGVPMGGIEIQKYHYANNWWKTVETKNCNMKMDN